MVVDGKKVDGKLSSRERRRVRQLQVKRERKGAELGAEAAIRSIIRLASDRANHNGNGHKKMPSRKPAVRRASITCQYGII